MTARENEAPPSGYERLVGDGIDAVGLSALAGPLTQALQYGSFYEFAAHHPEATTLTGRGIAYAVPLPALNPEPSVRAVVRRSRHGGLFGPITGERFLGRTRAPRELRTALRLERLGVATPKLLAYATYPDVALTRRADVVTCEVSGARDLAAEIMVTEGRGLDDELVMAVARLLSSLTVAGARHPDLNIKNILVTHGDGGEVEALVIDVDRVWFDQPGASVVTERNMRRLIRSALKWRRVHGLQIDDFDLQSIADAVDATLQDSGARAAGRT